LAAAKRFYEEGVKAADLGQWEKARERLLSSWRIRQHWKVAANLGRAEVRVGKFRDAAEHLTFFLREAAEVTPDDRRATQQMLDRAKARVGALSIAVDPPGAEVLVNGQVVGKAPLPGVVFVEPGQVLVEARLEGFTGARETRTAVAGKEESVSLQLAKLAAAPSSADVAPRPERPRPSLPLVIAGSVIAGAGLATGLGLFVSAGSMGSSARETSQMIVMMGNNCIAGNARFDSQCDGLKSTAALGDTFNRVGIGLLVGAGVVGLGTIVYALVPRALAPTSRTGTLRVLPVLAPGVSGLSSSGAF
jgi:hypothetical protein